MDRAGRRQTAFLRARAGRPRLAGKETLVKNPFKRRHDDAPSMDAKSLVRQQGLDKEQIAELLRTTPAAVDAFEEAYRFHALDAPVDGTNLFGMNSRQAAAMTHGDVDEAAGDCIRRITDELVAQTSVWHCTPDGRTACAAAFPALPGGRDVTREEVMALPREIRPQLTGSLVTKDIDEDSAPGILWFYVKSKEAEANGNHEQARQFYHRFRQGLDVLDLDPLTYAIIGTNPNSMGHWLPALVEAVRGVEGLRIPETTIARVPLPILQLARCEYMTLTPTTKRIVDEWAKRVFGLEADGDYFIKTGTYSSKFDFRNVRVHGSKEINELGEYLLFTHFQALQMASPLSRPCIYGVSTTNEWVVRRFIPDTEGRPTIYRGLPLRTEYRVFVDCDVDEVLGVHPYWDPKVMKSKFDSANDSDSLHDAITYRAAEPELTRTYEDNKDRVTALVAEILPNLDLAGQWSVDVMQSGEDLWLIDMALAENSAFYQEAVPSEKKRPSKEDWIPRLPEVEG